MSVPYTKMQTEALYIHSKELYDLISTNIALVGVLGSKGRIKIIEGGLGWRERVMYGSDPNAGHGSRYGQIGTDRLENMTMAEYDPAFFRTSLVINHVDRDQAKGEAALGDLIEDSWAVAKNYAVQKIGTDLWASSQADSNHPIPLPVFLPATDEGSQTGSARGGISSSDNEWWRSRHYGTAISDIGSEAGQEEITKLYLDCSRNAGQTAKPDFGLTTPALYAKFTSNEDAKRRYIPDTDMAKLGFESVRFGNMSILWDAECTAKAFYLLNSNKMRIKVLKQPNMKNIAANGKQLSLPMVITPFVRDIDTANDVALMYLTYQVCVNDLQGMGVLSNCTE
jgi:hypothetical protein